MNALFVWGTPGDILRPFACCQNKPNVPTSLRRLLAWFRWHRASKVEVPESMLHSAFLIWEHAHDEVMIPALSLLCRRKKMCKPNKVGGGIIFITDV